MGPWLEALRLPAELLAPRPVGLLFLPSVEKMTPQLVGLLFLPSVEKMTPQLVGLLFLPSVEQAGFPQKVGN
jgi:hypothetical protein